MGEKGVGREIRFVEVSFTGALQSATHESQEVAIRTQEGTADMRDFGAELHVFNPWDLKKGALPCGDHALAQRIMPMT